MGLYHISMLSIKQPKVEGPLLDDRVDKEVHSQTDKELEKVKLARLKRLQEFKRIERIYYPY